mmetsp:Transcript_23524/g.44363  ORF Transcript_23524/g.44363 Transcript_23524/m.44363 type:complete len:303 (-) Transcript_23524:693-1601(-)
MAATVDDIEGWHGHNIISCGSSRQAGQIVIQGHLHRGRASTANGHGHSQDGIGSQIRLAPAPVILSAVKDLDHDSVYLLLLGHIHSDELWCNLIIDIAHCLQDALAQQPLLVPITKLQSLVDASRGSTRHSRAEEMVVCHEIHLHGRVPARIENLPSLDALDNSRWGNDPVHLCHVARQIDQSVRVSPLIIIPRHKFHELVVQGNASCFVEDGRKRASDKVSRHDLRISEAKNALHRSFCCFVDRCRDGIHTSWLVKTACQVYHGDVWCWDSERHAGQLSVQRWDDFANSLGCACGGGNDVL